MGDVFAKRERKFIINFVYACANDLYSGVHVLASISRSRPMNIIKVTNVEELERDVVVFKFRFLDH